MNFEASMRGTHSNVESCMVIHVGKKEREITAYLVLHCSLSKSSPRFMKKFTLAVTYMCCVLFLKGKGMVVLM